ncbi:MAG: DUF3127 domain-containing protein [Muribaculaceae bacterium]|nr:DUF3127 domain-containing protein [Muribaculaceae bacterium]
MDFVAKLVQDLPMEEGVSKAGNNWRKKSWIVQTFGQYPKTVQVIALGNAIDNVHMELMKVYNLSVDLESREYNGRWYTDVKVFRAVETVDPSLAPQGYPAPGVNPAPAAPGVMPGNTPVSDPFSGAAQSDPFAGAAAFGDASDDLPF